MFSLKNTLLCALACAAIQAQAEINCMPAALAFATSDFVAARQSGLVATDIHDQVVNLGTNVSISSIEIRDDNKESYTVAFHLDSINGMSTNSMLQTNVVGVKNQSCAIA